MYNKLKINYGVLMNFLQSVRDFIPLFSSRSLPERFKPEEGKIHEGNGEYIVFRTSSNGENSIPSKSIYEQVYQIFNTYAPTAIMSKERGLEAMEQATNRYEIIRSKVKALDPTLEIAFVPRTLYELVLIRKCIQEDVTNGSICNFTNRFEHRSNNILSRQRKCWHLCCFDNVGDNNHAGVKEIAYRLNKAMIKAFSPTPGGFTHQELAGFVEKEITFLKTHHANGLNEQQKLADCTFPGPTTNFGFESNRGNIRSTGIRNETDAQIVRKAVALECSKAAKHTFFIYRGSNFKVDSPKSGFFSLSYGSSLFAGCVFDGGATPFHFMRQPNLDAYAVPVPFDQLHTSPFYIPPTNAIAQLFGYGEYFHARTKGADGNPPLMGFNAMFLDNNAKTDHLKSSMKRKELDVQFSRYKRECIQLKPDNGLKRPNDNPIAKL